MVLQWPFSSRGIGFHATCMTTPSLAFRTSAAEEPNFELLVTNAKREQCKAEDSIFLKSAITDNLLNFEC